MTEVRFTRTALKARRAMPSKRWAQIRAAIDALAAGKRSDVASLKGRPEYRLRVGAYRVIFRREADTLIVVDVRTRGAAYRG